MSNLLSSCSHFQAEKVFVRLQQAEPTAGSFPAVLTQSMVSMYLLQPQGQLSQEATPGRGTTG